MCKGCIEKNMRQQVLRLLSDNQQNNKFKAQYPSISLTRAISLERRDSAFDFVYAEMFHMSFKSFLFSQTLK